MRALITISMLACALAAALAPSGVCAQGLNADEAQAPEILAALRSHWSALPEQAQKAWQPPESIATNWSGEPCPTY